VSTLERGIKQPTLGKIDDLASVLNLHPMTLLALSYCPKRTDREISDLLGRIQLELAAVIDAHAQSEPSS
jgi:hypothetical protein